MLTNDILRELSEFVCLVYGPVSLSKDSDHILIKSDNGDIGIDTNNDEITIFGLGCHSHYFFLAGEGQLEMDMEMAKQLIHGLITGKTVGYGIFKDGNPQSGGFVDDDEISNFINDQTNRGNEVVIRYKDKVCKYEKCS